MGIRAEYEHQEGLQMGRSGVFPEENSWQVAYFRESEAGEGGDFSLLHVRKMVGLGEAGKRDSVLDLSHICFGSGVRISHLNVENSACVCVREGR